MRDCPQQGSKMREVLPSFPHMQPPGERKAKMIPGEELLYASPKFRVTRGESGQLQVFQCVQEKGDWLPGCAVTPAGVMDLYARHWPETANLLARVIYDILHERRQV